MTQPAPNANNGTSVEELVDMVRTAPRWLIVSIVVAGGLLAWWLLRGRETTVNDYGDWRSRAIDLLVDRGYYRPNAERAVDSYMRGGYMSPEDVQLITIVLRVMGPPNNNRRDDIPKTATGNGGDQSTEYPGDISDYPSVPDGALPGEYWYVPVAPAGWSSTYNGIALQFYGTTSRAAIIQQANPDYNKQVYEKLPVGALIKVPRS